MKKSSNPENRRPPHRKAPRPVARRNLGLAFERAIAAIQAKFDPGATITQNESLHDRHGHRHQCDVVVRGKVGGHQILGVIECKDLARKVGTPEVEAFATRAASLRADLKIIVLRRGFSRPALELASHHGIRTMSLLKRDRVTKGISVGDYVYLRRFNWRSIRASAMFPDGSSRPIEQSLETVTVNGMRIWDWLPNEIFTTYRQVTTVGWHSLRLRFRLTAQLGVAKATWSISVLEIQLWRDIDCLRTPAFAVGEGLVEFNPNILHVPGHATLETSFVLDQEFTNWESVADVPDDGPRLFPIVINAFWAPRVLPESSFSVFEVAEVSMDVNCDAGVRPLQG
jgi:restriction endonuclease